jgi:hypothetical protein
MSFERDTVDVGEYPKAFRRQHPIQQARAERAARREVRRRLAEGREDVEEVRRRTVRKWPPVRLGDLIQQKADRRARVQGEPRKSVEARERRRQRRRQSGSARSSE